MERFIHDETNGIDYELVGEYYIPMLKAPEAPKIGRFGKMRLNYIRNNKKCYYDSLFLSGELNHHLESVDQEAEEMYLRLIKQFAENEGVTEQLKSEDQMLWVGQMNNIRNRAMEIVNSKVIFV